MPSRVLDRALKPTEIDEYVSFRLGTDPLLVRRRLSGGSVPLWHAMKHVRPCRMDDHQAGLDRLPSPGITLAPDEVYQYSPSPHSVLVAKTSRCTYHRDAAYFRKAGTDMIAAVVPENSAAFPAPRKDGLSPLRHPGMYSSAGGDAFLLDESSCAATRGECHSQAIVYVLNTATVNSSPQRY